MIFICQYCFYAKKSTLTKAHNYWLIFYNSCPVKRKSQNLERKNYEEFRNSAWWKVVSEYQISRRQVRSCGNGQVSNALSSDTGPLLFAVFINSVSEVVLDSTISLCSRSSVVIDRFCSHCKMFLTKLLNC